MIPIFNYLIFLFVLPIVTWRLTHLFVEEDGPFDIFLKLRIYVSNSNFFKELFTCFYCFSIWMGFLIALIFIPIEFILLGGFYLSGTSILLERHK
jgi:hypothetical protein